MSVDFVVRWKWYFEYIAALVKTKNPYCHVILTIGQQNTLCGEDYITTKTISLLRHKKATLEKLKKAQYLTICSTSQNQTDRLK